MSVRPAFACLALAAAAGPAAAQKCPTDPGVCGAVLGGLGEACLGSAVGASWAQPAAPDLRTGRSAQVPDPQLLDRLRLAEEWASYVPLAGGKDALALVQVVDEELVLAQTRAGLVVAFDARTGARQWAYRLPAAYAATYPAAAAGRFVFVANLATLVCLNRLTGQVEFVQSLTGSVTAGPVAAAVPVYGTRDNQKVAVAERVTVFLTLNGNRLAAFPVPEAGRVALAPPPAPALLPPPSVQVPPPDALGAAPAGTNRTPSLTTLPVVVPPYTLYGRQTRLTPSYSSVPDLSQPNTRNPDYLRANQRTPSVTSIPPSVARAFELTNLRARPPEVNPLWVYGSTRRLGFEPVVSVAVPGRAGARVFAPTAGPRVTAVNAEDGRVLFGFDLEAPVVAPPAGPAAVGDAELGVFPLADGAVVAVDLSRGTPDAPVVVWRTVVGGVLNRQPLLTPDAVYVAGDGAGVAQVDSRTGDVRWRTAPQVDRLLAVGREFVYARDRAGNTLVYPRFAPTPAGGRLEPVAVLPAGGYTVPVTNTRTDRLLLAAENGLVVSLRDALPASARPTGIAPLALPALPGAAAPAVVNPDTPPPSDPMPRKDPPPVAPPAKKDAEPKKDGA